MKAQRAHDHMNERMYFILSPPLSHTLTQNWIFMEIQHMQ